MLEEARDTGACVLRTEHLDECIGLGIESPCQRVVETSVDRGLCQAHRDDRTLAELACPHERLLLELRRGHRAVDQTDGECFVGADLAAAPNHLLGARRTDESWES